MTDTDSFDLFENLNIPDALKQALKDHGFTSPTPIQAKAIPRGLLGKDILGTAQTGTGKTLAFGIPLLTRLYHQMDIQGLILAPTRELAAQIHKVLRGLADEMEMRGVLMVGGESFPAQKQALKKGADFIVATPGRLLDHMGEGLSLKHVGVLVLDEVDRMLDMGFMPQVQKVVQDIPKKRQTMLFSATLPGEILRFAHSLLHEPEKIEIGLSTVPVSQVKQEIIETTFDKKPEVLLKFVTECEGRILIFTRTKDRADSVANQLHKKGHPVVCLHGGRTQSQRKGALDRFRKGDPRIMVATDLAGRGIDIADIEHVINYDLPATREDYIHRVGRTGRAGREGSAVTFVIPTDLDFPKIVHGQKGSSRKVFSSSRRRR